MALEPTEYVRKVFAVEAFEVSYDNIHAVAEWCKGRIDEETAKILGGNEITLPVVKFPGQGEDKGKDLVARLGYFVVYSRGRFRVYRPEQFHRAFEKKVEFNVVETAFAEGLHKVEMETENEVWIEPGDTTDEIAEKLGFKPTDYCVDHNTALSECGEKHMDEQAEAVAGEPWVNS